PAKGNGDDHFDEEARNTRGDRRGDSSSESLRIQSALDRRRGARGDRRGGGGRRDRVHGIHRSHAAGGKRRSNQRALQVREQVVPSGENAHPGERNGDRRRGVRGDGRTLFGRIRGSDPAVRRRRGQGRRQAVARRGIQAAHFTLRFSGDGRGRAKAA